MLALVIKLGIGSTGNRRYARDYCCSFEKSCLFFLKECCWCALKISHLAQEHAVLQNSAVVWCLFCVHVVVHQNE